MNKNAKFINRVLAATGGKSYLEIGVEDARSCFNHIAATDKVGVDPNPVKLPANDDQLYCCTSDEYFATHAAGRKFYVIFVDGLHTFDQCLRDIEAAAAHLAPGGVILVDDVVCESAWLGRPHSQYKPHEAWKGQCWEAFLHAVAQWGCPYAAFPEGGNGIGVLAPGYGHASGVEPQSLPMPSWEEYHANRALWLNEKPLTELEAWLGALQPAAQTEVKKPAKPSKKTGKSEEETGKGEEETGKGEEETGKESAQLSKQADKTSDKN